MSTSPAPGGATGGGDANGAIETLQGSAAGAQNSPDYLAFYAALLQRQSRHREAAEQPRREHAERPVADRHLRRAHDVRELEVGQLADAQHHRYDADLGGGHVGEEEGGDRKVPRRREARTNRLPKACA